MINWTKKWLTLIINLSCDSENHYPYSVPLSPFFCLVFLCRTFWCDPLLSLSPLSLVSLSLSLLSLSSLAHLSLSLSALSLISLLSLSSSIRCSLALIPSAVCFLGEMNGWLTRCCSTHISRVTWPDWMKRGGGPMGCQARGVCVCVCVCVCRYCMSIWERRCQTMKMLWLLNYAFMCQQSWFILTW